MVKWVEFMRQSKNVPEGSPGMTLIETLIALLVLVLVMAVIVPQIRAIQNSWGSKRENTEVIQNGRVLVDHVVSNLSQAKKVTAISAAAQTNGFIEFENNDGNTMRYEIDSDDNYVVFGPVVNLSDLAGPVSQLQFTCYDACDLDTPITDVNEIRTVKIETTFTNYAELGRDQSFIGRAYLRTNAGGSGDGLTITEEPSAEFEFDTDNGAQPVLARIDAQHHLCVYQGGKGAGGMGYAVVLTVDTDDWTISKETPLLFDDKNCGGPDLAQINATNYLCVYQGDKQDGYAVILTVDPATWQITRGTPFEFDTDYCSGPVLSQASATDFLCAYTGKVTPAVGGGFAKVLTVNTVTKTVTAGATYVFDPSNASNIALANVNDTHHLCAFSKDGGTAVVLMVDTVTKTVSDEANFFQYDLQQALHNELYRIDENHYLCAWRGWGESGNVAILTVDTGTWAIGKGTTILYDTSDKPQSEYPEFAWISGSDYLLAYAGTGPSESDIGKAVVLTVDTQTDTVTKGADYIHDNIEGANPSLSKVDDSHYLCAYKGEFSDGFATILTVGEVITP
jgi:type II secretory pathway pseudopilin PulG